MSLVKFHPTSELQSEIDSMLNTLWTPRSSNGARAWQPRLDLTENDEAYTLSADLPGMVREDIQLTVKENVLTLEGLKKDPYENAESGSSLKERIYGPFHRTFRLVDQVDVDKMKATYRDGVLTVTVPKVEQAKPRQIEVKVA